MSTRLKILRQRLMESFALVDVFMWMSYLGGRLALLLGKPQVAFARLGQAHRTTRSETLKSKCLRWLPSLLPEVAAPPVDEGRRPSIEATFGGRLMVLKKPLAEEKGVLLVKFSELFKRMLHEFDMKALLDDYHLVLEPSWSGYFRPDILAFTQFDEPIFVLAAECDDFRLLETLGSNLVPVPLGPCDWVDPRVAAPHLDQPKRFDIVMNSHWGSLKRHYVLFEALGRMPDLTAVLIGGNWAGGTPGDIEALARHYGVRDRLSMHQGIPFSEVMELTCQARMAVLLSLKEGSNRALAESMFCDVPVLLLDEHVGGIRKNVVPETGEIVPQRRLKEGIRHILANAEEYSPRAWAVRNISCVRSTEILDEVIRTHALELGQPWTRDLLVRSNSPEPRYYEPESHEAMATTHDELRRYLMTIPA